MEPEKTLHAGVIGLGWAGEQHLKGYLQIPGVTVVAAADPVAERVMRVKDTYQVPYVYTSYQDLLARDDLDLVSVATPNFLHAPVTIAALESGRHVLCEKPLAHNYTAACAMVQAAVKAGRVLEVAFNHRRRGDVRTLKTFIESGGMGRIYYARARWLRRAGIPGAGWFTSREMSGGGPMIDLGVHMLDMALHLMGEPEALAVSGATYAEFGPRGRGSARQRAGETYDVEDLAVGFVRLAGGATLHLEASWAMHRESGDVFGVTLYGTEGGGEINVVRYSAQDTLRVFADMAGVPADMHLEPAKGEGHLDVVREFLATIRGGNWAAYTGAEALRRSAIIEACYLSAQRGSEVRLSELGTA